MAEMQADRPLAGAGRKDPSGRMKSLGQMTHGVGAVLSVGLVICMGVWGYKLLMRDVSGVPVVRALEGPMRIQPEDPGGRKALYQGLAVNAVAADGGAEPAADRLILAPAPLDLDLEDVPTANDTPLQLAAMETSDETSESRDTAPAPANDDQGRILALADALSEGVEPLENPAESVVPDKTGENDSAGPGLGRSLRPRLRPADLAEVRTAALNEGDAAVKAAAAAVGGVADIDPASLPVGTRLAQLGAYKSEEIARKEWLRLSGRFEEYLGGKSRVIQKAESGGRSFYRLRAQGFDDLAEARRFCSALVAEDAECIPVVTR